MLHMTRNSLNDRAAWEKANVKLPEFDVQAVADATAKAPIWVHFGAGNIFRGFVAVLQQRLLNEGLADRGIIAADTFDYDIIDKIYTPFDNLTMNVTLNADATTTREIIASVTEGLRADSTDEAMMHRLREIFTSESLQMVSFTITEKGYALYRADGTLLPIVEEDMANGPAKARHAMSMVAALLLARYEAGAAPVAVVSMDNCSHNGEKLSNSVRTVAEAWVKNGFAPQGFADYLSDPAKVSFPWSMIDKITPRPAKSVEESLAADGIADMAPIKLLFSCFVFQTMFFLQPHSHHIGDKIPLEAYSFSYFRHRNHKDMGSAAARAVDFSLLRFFRSI